MAMTPLYLESVWKIFNRVVNPTEIPTNTLWVLITPAPLTPALINATRKYNADLGPAL